MNTINTHPPESLEGVMTAQYGETEGLESLHVDDLIIGKIVGRDSYRDNDTAIVCTEGVGYEADAMGRISVPYEWNNKVERGGWVDVSAQAALNACLDLTAASFIGRPVQA